MTLETVLPYIVMVLLGIPFLFLLYGIFAELQRIRWELSRIVDSIKSSERGSSVTIWITKHNKD